MKGFSFSSLERMFAHSRAAANKRERLRLINSQKNIDKELPPEYNLVSVNFNNETRVAKVLISATQRYRTIEKYVTKDYVRYPIYSDWKTKNKRIEKTVKLTNKNLEELNLHSDEFVSMFAEEIIVNIGDKSLTPSWLHKKWLKEEYDEQINTLNSTAKKLKSEFQEQVDSTNATNAKIDKESLPLKKYSDTLNAKIKKLSKKIDKISTAKKSTFLSIITLHIYASLISPKRIAKLNKRKDTIQRKFDDTSRYLAECNTKKEANLQIVETKRSLLKRDLDEIDKEKGELLQEFRNEMKKVSALPETISTEQFTPLSVLAGTEASKIIGCYIIRNKKNDKCYVGQSKDVIKRLKQHFNGTTPKNAIFAEDYYSSPPEERQNLFEFKIIELSTKDEMDKTEKKLIDAYAAFSHGYNGTSGNN